MSQTQIPTFSELQAIVENEKTLNKLHDVSTRQQRLAEALQTRKTTRESWTEEKREEYQQRLDQLREADKQLTEFLSNAVVNEFRVMLLRNASTWRFEYFLPTDLGVHPLSIIYGFWKRTRHSHDYLSRHEAGLEIPFWTKFEQLMRANGYDVKDVSDTKRSRRTFMEIKPFSV